MNAPVKKPEVISMGCRLNLAESNALAEQLAGRDDIVIINSCAVTNESSAFRCHGGSNRAQ